MTGTDLEVQLVARVQLAGAATDGEITVPARKLMDIWRALPDGADIEFTVDESRAVLKTGRSRFQLATLPAAEFPSIDEGAAELELGLAQEQLRYLIEQTAFSMAQQDVRYFLNGMLLEVDAEHVRTVATDGHRLAMCTLSPGSGGSRQQVIVPAQGCTRTLARAFARETIRSRWCLAVTTFERTSVLIPSRPSWWTESSPTTSVWFPREAPARSLVIVSCCARRFSAPLSSRTRSIVVCASRSIREHHCSGEQSRTGRS